MVAIMIGVGKPAKAPMKKPTKGDMAKKGKG